MQNINIEFHNLKLYAYVSESTSMHISNNVRMYMVVYVMYVNKII